MEKVIHIFGKLDFGGAELRTLAVSRHLTDKDYKIDYCCLSGEKGGIAHLFEQQGSSVFPIKLSFSFPLQFYKLLKKEKYTVVHSHIAHSSGIMMAIAFIAGVEKRVTHYRSTGQLNSTKRLTKSFIENIKRVFVHLFSTKITAVSEGTIVAAWSKNWRKDRRCSVIYNGLDEIDDHNFCSREYIYETAGIDRKSKTILHVGNMTAPKNHLRLLDIFKKIREVSKEDFKLLLVGREDEPVRSAVREKIESLELTPHVFILGKRADVMHLMYSADGLIHPSLWEGLPGTVLEAALLDLPTLATDLTGVREIAQHFPCVRSLSLEDSNEAWASTFLALIRSHARLPAADLNSRLRRTPFSMEACVGGFENLWS